MDVIETPPRVWLTFQSDKPVVWCGALTKARRTWDMTTRAGSQEAGVSEKLVTWE